MMLSHEPVNGFFPNLQRYYLLEFRQDKDLYGFGDLEPIFKVKGEFSLKICLEPVNGLPNMGQIYC